MSIVGEVDYKESETSEIPVDWDVALLEELAYIDSESLPIKTPPDYEFRYISLGDVDRGELVGANQCIRFSDAPSRARRIVKSGDILFSTVRPNLKGHYFARKTEGDVIASTGFAVIRAKHKTASASYLYQFLLSAKVDEQIEKLTVGSNYPAINSSDVKAIKVIRPPLPEQQKIAAILTAVDDKMDVIARQIAATKTLKQGLMQMLFSRGVGTQDATGHWVPHAVFKDSDLGEIPASWDAKSLVKLAQESRRRNSGSLDDNLLCGVLKSQGLVPMRERVKGASTERCKVVEPDAFAYNPMRINIGSIARNLSQNAVMVSPDYVVFAPIPSLLSADYLDHFRKSDGWTRFVGQSGDGGVRIRIYFDHLSHVLIPTPPMLEQKRIAEILNNVDAKITSLGDKQTYYQTLKRGLMQKLLTGEWRVKRR